MADTITLGLRLKFDGKEVVGGIDVSRDQLRKLAVDARRAGDQLAGGFSKASEGVRSISGMLAQARNAMLGFVAIADLRRAVDGFAELNARLALIETTARDARNAFAGVFRIAQAGGQDLGTVAEVYGRIARNARALNLDQQAVLQTTQAVANAVRLSGVSADSARAALLQFGQALASGTLRGDELNSIMEQTPALAEAIARGMGKTVGELRKLGEEGKLTATEVIAAIRNESARLEAESGRMADTIGQSLTRLGNAWNRYLGENTAGAARLAGAAIDALAANLGKLANTVAAAAAGFAAFKFAGWVAGAGGLVTALSRINPVTAAIGLAVTALGISFQDFQRKGEQAAENVRAALDKLQSGAARVAADLRGMTVANVNKALADLERDRARLVADLDRRRKEWEALRRVPITSKNIDDLKRRDTLSAEVLGGEQALKRLDAEIAGIRSSLGQAGRRDIDTYFDQFGNKAEQTRKKLADLADATRKALKAAEGTANPAAERRRILDNASSARREILSSGRSGTGAGGKDTAAEREAKAYQDAIARQDEAAIEAARIRLDASLDSRSQALEAARKAELIDEATFLRARAALDEEAARAELAALQARQAALRGAAADPKAAASKRAAAEADLTLVEARIDALQAKILDINQALGAELAAVGAAGAKADADKLAQAEAIVDAIRRETFEIGLANDERALAADLAALEASGIDRASEAYARLRGEIIKANEERAKARELEDKNRAAAEASEQAWKNFGQGVQQSIASALTQADGSFKSFARGIVDLFKNIVAQAIAKSISEATLKSLPKGGGGNGNVLADLFKLFGFADGGWTGPGAKHQPAGVVHADEYVFSKAAVRRLGVGFLDNLHRMTTGAALPVFPRLAYADGGLVNLPAQAAQPLSIRIVNAVDEAVVREYMATPAGERTIVNVIRRNASTIRQNLGV